MKFEAICKFTDGFLFVVIKWVKDTNLCNVIISKTYPLFFEKLFQRVISKHQQQIQMKNIIYLILPILLLNGINFNAQNAVSQEIKVPIESSFDFITSSNGNVYFYCVSRIKMNVVLTIYKFKESNLELIEKKDIVICDFHNPKVFNNSCSILASFKNNKFYFFYSLISKDDFYINLKTCDVNLNLIKDFEMGTIVKTGRELRGEFGIEYSPDDKTALIFLKNRWEDKGISTYYEIFENTEVIYYNLFDDKVIYDKRLPIELQGLRLKTDCYRIDNEGNLTFKYVIAEKKGGKTIKAAGMGFLEKTYNNVEFSEIDVSSSSTISDNLWQLKNGDLIYCATLSDNILFKFIPLNKEKISRETIISNKAVADLNMNYTFSKMNESQNGYFISYLEMKGYSQDGYTILFINRAGELVWQKKIKLSEQLYKYTTLTNFIKNVFFFNNKIHVFYVENKPFELTNIKENLINAKNLDEFQVSEIIIDEIGNMYKNNLHDCAEFEMDLNPKFRSLNKDNENAYMILESFKLRKIKKIVFK